MGRRRDYARSWKAVTLWVGRNIASLHAYICFRLRLCENAEFNGGNRAVRKTDLSDRATARDRDGRKGQVILENIGNLRFHTASTDC